MITSFSVDHTNIEAMQLKISLLTEVYHSYSRPKTFF